MKGNIYFPNMLVVEGYSSSSLYKGNKIFFVSGIFCQKIKQIFFSIESEICFKSRLIQSMYKYMYICMYVSYILGFIV